MVVTELVVDGHCYLLCSRGSPRMRSPITLRCTSDVPPAMLAAFDHNHCRCHGPHRPDSGALHRQRRLGHLLGHVRPGQLHPARLGTGLTAARQLRQRPPVVRPQHHERHVGVDQRVGDVGVVERAVAGRLGEQPCQVSLVHHFLFEREVGPPLVGQRRRRHGPALPGRPDQMPGRHGHVLEEDLVELGLARDLHEGSDLDTLGLHVHHQQRQTPGSGRPGLGPGQTQSVPGELRVRRPHLLAAHPPSPGIGIGFGPR